MSNFNDYLSKGARNDGTQSSDRLGNFFREAAAHDERYKARNDGNPCGLYDCAPYDWEAEDRYYKAAREFDKNGLRGGGTYDFSKD